MIQKNNAWTAEDIEKLKKLRADGVSIRDACIQMGRSYKSVENAAMRYGIPAAEAQADVTAEDDYWRDRYNEVNRKYAALVKERTVVDVLAESIRDIAPRSYETQPSRYVPPKEPVSQPQHAVLHISDSHVGQVVSADQTLTFGSYDTRIFLDRLAYLERAVTSICTQHVNTDLPVLHVCWGGDLLHGDLQHANEAGHVMTLFHQYYVAGHAFAQFIRNVSQHFRQTICHGVVGNHTRWSNQKKMPTVNRFSNLDMFCMTLMEALTREVAGVKWDLTTQPFAEFEVQGWLHRMAHGDHLKGGDRALGIPAHAVGRELSSTGQLYSKHRRRPVNYFLHGHLHRPMELPHANGDVLVNGGWPGVDEYALTNNFNPVDPQQRLYFVHPRFGRTANYYLSLRHAEPGSGAKHYTLPVFGGNSNE